MAIRKPSSIAATTNPPSGSTIIKASGGTFVLLMWGFDFDHSVHTLEEITADGDAYTTLAHNGLQRGSYVLYGHMIAGVAMGLANLSSTSNNAGNAFKVKMDSTSDAGSFHNVNAIVTRVRGRWRHVGAIIPVVMHVTVTNTNPATIEASS